MLEWAIKEIVKEEAEEEKKRKEEEAEMNPPAETATSAGLLGAKGMGSLVYLVLLIPLALIVLNYFVL